jgi:hypothetical protein
MRAGSELSGRFGGSNAGVLYLVFAQPMFTCIRTLWTDHDLCFLGGFWNTPANNTTFTSIGELTLFGLRVVLASQGLAIENWNFFLKQLDMVNNAFGVRFRYISGNDCHAGKEYEKDLARMVLNHE